MERACCGKSFNSFYGLTYYGRVIPPKIIMKIYNSKIEMVLECDDFMEYSDEVMEKFGKVRDKNGKPLNEKDRWRVINKHISKKLKNSRSVKGVCTCDDDFLCKHRKKYLKELLRSK